MSSTSRPRCATRWWSGGAPRSRPGAGRTARPWPAAPSPPRRTASGSRSCCGRGGAGGCGDGGRGRRGREPAPRALVVEVPLLFESGMDAAFDATLAVVADEAVRRERAGVRGHAALDERTSRQLTQEEKAARATYTVANSGTIEDLQQTLDEVLEKLNQGS